MRLLRAIVLVFLYVSACQCADPDLSDCEVATKTEQGYVCGRIRKATNGDDYASFRGIPYAKQPLGQLRFQELQPAEPFDGGIFNATEAGPICAQVDIFYQPNGLVSPLAVGEDCIRINIHIRSEYLPDPDSSNSGTLLPVLFWIHGGSFSYGSGDADFHGPEYLMTKDIVFVTINYRLNALGFLSLDNEYIPGNNGLRDAITALKWVQRNIKNFGGDPERVTVAGQSAGGVMAHMLSISPAANGLFKQVYAASGQSIASFYTYSPTYAKLVNAIFFTVAGINTLQTPKKVYEDLVAAPMEDIQRGNKALLDLFGLVSFAPVIEKPQANFTTVLPKSAEDLLNEGAGKDYPIIIGFCSNEAQAYKKRLAQVAITLKLMLLPSLTLPQNLLFLANTLTVPVLTTKQLAEYFNVTFITLEKFVVAATDSYYKYPGQRLTQKRLNTRAAKTYLYQFGYPGVANPIKESQNVTYSGAGHVEDITYFFRLNTFLGPQTVPNELDTNLGDDNKMKVFMTNLITNYVINGTPASDSDWPPTQSDLKFQNIEVPLVYNFTPPTPYMEDKLKYFSNLYEYGGLGAQ